jgi:hypothetical protein
MFLDLKKYDPHEPRVRLCRSCHRIVEAGAPSEELQFDDVHGHRLSDFSGTYHVACARPFLGLKHALSLLEFRPF